MQQLDAITDWFLRTVAPFLCGMLVAANLSGLVPINPDYNYAWWKVGVALLVATCMPLLAKDPSGR